MNEIIEPMSSSQERLLMGYRLSPSTPIIIEDGALIGMGAIIMNGAKVGKGSVIGAGALVKQDMTVPDNCLAMGIPAKVIRKNSNNAYKENIAWAKKYVELAKIHKKKFEPLK